MRQGGDAIRWCNAVRRGCDAGRRSGTVMKGGDACGDEGGDVGR